ncbi:hypothetical protein ACTXT7_009025, partial [Hymenolepis weldensis]
MTPQFFPQDLRVNADADVYAETLQTILLSSYLEQRRDPIPSSKIRLYSVKLSKPKIGWIAENFHHH